MGVLGALSKLWRFSLYGWAFCGILWFLIWESVLGASQGTGEIGLQISLTPILLLMQIGLLFTSFLGGMCRIIASTVRERPPYPQVSQKHEKTPFSS